MLSILPLRLTAASSNSDRKGGTLLFKSGFEDGVSIKGTAIVGLDQSSPAGMNNWDRLSEYLPWVKATHAYLEGGSIQISPDPQNPGNKVLHFHNTGLSREKTRSRTQWSLLQEASWDDPGGPNKFDQQFYRYRMFIPLEIKAAIPLDQESPWFGIFESHSWISDETRHVIRISKNRNGPWYFFARQEQAPADKKVRQSMKIVPTYQNTEYQNVEVPFGEWFTLDIFFKYHESQGRFFAAITREGRPRQTIADFKGATRKGTKLHDQMIFKMYHSADWLTLLPGGTHVYYDNLEIWSDFPAGYDHQPTIKK